jgi:ABC-2 type transport system permease protein
MTAVLRQQMTLYSRIFSLGMQNSLVYRWNFLVRALAGLVPLAGSLFLWKAVFSEPESTNFSGYDYHLMMAYFLTLIVMDALTSPVEDDFAIARDIKDGKISQVLLKPIDYFTYRVSLFLASRLIYSAVVLLPTIAVLYAFRHFFSGVHVGETLPLALVAALGSAFLQFTIAYASAMLAFWLLDIGSVVFILFSVEYIASGHIFPLDVLPAPVYAVVRLLPFAYEYYFPVGIFLDRIHGAEIWQGFLLQWAWIAFFYGLGLSLWRRGLRHYTSVGN